MLNVKCFENCRIKKWFCTIKTKSKIKNVQKDKVVVFKKLPHNMRNDAVFEKHNAQSGFSMVVNKKGDIISGHSPSESILLNSKIDALIGKNLIQHGESGLIMPPVLTMLQRIMEEVQKQKKMVGCIVCVSSKDIMDEYILCGYPIVNDVSSQSTVLSVLLVKQMSSNIIDVDSILLQDEPESRKSTDKSN